jgi:ATP-dependent exoDNAse (exonuclease V) alpha subunit
MISYQQFSNIELRLRELKDGNKLFGGINVLLFGDLMQLPPVNGTPIYQQPQYMDGNLHLFHQFQYCELNENMRQRGNQQFIQLLNSLREGRMTLQHYRLLQRKMRESRQQGDFAAGQAVRIVPTVALANQHNQQVINEMANVTKYQVDANNEVPATTDLHRDLVFLLPADENKTGGIPNQLIIFVGMKVMLKRNIDISRKLCNGSIGHITAIEYADPNGDLLQQIPTVEVDFGNNVGRHLISAVTVEFDLLEGKGPCKRTMLPLVPAYAVTVHKLQGTTLDRAVIDLGANYFSPGQKFVALSRCRSLDTLEISSLDQSGLLGDNVCNMEALQELNRLRNLPAIQYK